MKRRRVTASPSNGRAIGSVKRMHAVAVALAERGADGVGEAAARLVADDEPIDDDEQLLRERDVDRSRSASSSRCLTTPSTLTRTNPCARRFSTTTSCVTSSESCSGNGDVEARAGGQREHRVGDRLHRVGLAARGRTCGQIRAADARPEQPQVVVDLGGRADGGARGLGRILLLDRDGGREPVDGIDVGLLHALEELPRVRRERLDVAPLSLGVDRVEGERRLARAGRPGDDGEGAPRDLEVEAFEIVLPRAADDDAILHRIEFSETRTPKKWRSVARLRLVIWRVERFGQ